MADDKPKSPWEGGDGAKALETLAAASAIGITVATQAMGFWLSVLSGATSSLRGEQAEPAAKKAPEAKPQVKPEAREPRPSAEIVELKPKAAPAPAEPKAAPAPVAPKVEAKPVAEAAPVIAEPAVAAPVADKPKPVVVKKAAPVKAKPAKAAPAVALAPKVAAAPTKSSQPKALERPAQPDDLKQIKGVGPKLETALNGFGIWTLAQIAALGPAEIGWLDDNLGLSGRIVRDGWVEAARAAA